MLNAYMIKGASDALARFGIKTAIELGAAGPSLTPPQMTPSLTDQAKSFGRGQFDAGKALLGNARGALGGAPTPAFGEAIAHGAGPVSPTAWHQGQAMGNLKSLAPSLALAGGAYLWHRHNQQKQQQQMPQMMPQQMMGY